MKTKTINGKLFTKTSDGWEYFDPTYQVTVVFNNLNDCCSFSDDNFNSELWLLQQWRLNQVKDLENKL